jgi:molybdenum cofactor synthesis domain-containing protein
MTPVTAAILVIGDEILSGRTQDANVQTIARALGPAGIRVREVRVVSDDQAAIVAALNALRAGYSYVFTTGGIGPTHDDITADAVAAAFGASIGERADALAILRARYPDSELTAARRRMARIPEGASLIANPVSGAPGFQLGNVFVMAGVPSIMRGMLPDVLPRLEGGAPVLTVSVRGPGLREGDFAAALGALAEASPDLDFGSYPWFGTDGYGAALVARGTDRDAVIRAGDALEALARSFGADPEREGP